VLRNGGLAEDVLQEVYQAIWQKAASYNPALGKPVSWAIALTKNKALDKLRSLKRSEAALSRMAEQQISDTSESPKILNGEAHRILREALSRLDGRQRRLIELAFFEGKAHAEIAAETQQPLGTVKARIRRGMIVLRENLDTYFERQ
jgi:RNA polymerase sigma-70 factor (ECF subfamily)